MDRPSVPTKWSVDRCTLFLGYGSEKIRITHLMLTRPASALPPDDYGGDGTPRYIELS